MWQFGWCGNLVTAGVRECTSSQLASRQARKIISQNFKIGQPGHPRSLGWFWSWFGQIMFLCDHIKIPGLPASTNGIYFQPASFSASSYSTVAPSPHDDGQIWLHLPSCWFWHPHIHWSPWSHRSGPKSTWAPAAICGRCWREKEKRVQFAKLCKPQILVWDHLGWLWE